MNTSMRGTLSEATQLNRLRPLEGRTILDLSSLLPGPYVGKLLAGQGARVIKIENPRFPDPARQMGAYYRDLNSCKEIISLDWASDPASLIPWLQQADGLIEAFLPKAKIKLRLQEHELYKAQPKLCILSMTGFPEDGPNKDRPAHDLNFQALTGALSLNREQPGLPWADLLSAHDAAFALACLLDRQSRTGHGGRISVSMYWVMKAAQSGLKLGMIESGETPMYGETLFSGKFPCYHIYTCKDGRRVAVGALEEKFWHTLCDILKTPEVKDSRYTDAVEGERVKQVIAKRFQDRSWDDWAPEFERTPCCVEPVLTYQEVQ